MKTCTRIHPSILAALAALALVSPVHAGSISSNPTAPAVGADDIANYGEVTGTDKWWAENTTPPATDRPLPNPF